MARSIPASRIERAENLLVRGATSSIGFATMALARAAGLEITATTRSATKADELVAAGVPKYPDGE